MLHWHCHDYFHGMPVGATAGGIAVVIDVLRASTTIATALAHGAAAVRPVADLAEARALAATLAAGTLLGGERGGVRIEGFDLGNSPREYTPDRVAGKTIVITTTNGTAALEACRDARVILVGAIVNRTAVADAVRRLTLVGGRDDVHLVCAGTDGVVSAEDVLAAGAILDAASAAGAADVLDDVALAALAFYRRAAAAPVPQESLVAEFRRSPGGSNLVDLGMEADLPVAAAIDSLTVVPRLDPASGRLI
ncbi:MAG: 2-phosphosulfolactate phosphatase [Planctomycetia bacterium]|nr:2-phosphosulfolactate phosphatase [Planctomycetia bacterium]